MPERNPIIEETVLYEVSQGKWLRKVLVDMGNPITCAEWDRWCEGDPSLKARWLAVYNGGGKPTTFSQSVVDEICHRLSNGEPLAEICRDESMPAVRTVSDWANERKDVSAKIAHAREDGEEYLLAQCLGIARTTHEGVEIEDDGEKVKTKRGDMLGHRKLQIETVLKLLAKWNPKKWGDLTKLEVGGKLDVGGALDAARQRLAQRAADDTASE